MIAVYVYDDDHLKLVFNSFGKDDTVNIALDLGENDDNSGLSDVSKSSPILSNGQPVWPSGNNRVVFLFVL